MIQPLRVVALDLSPRATAIAHTHDSHGDPRLAVRTLDTAMRPLHQQIDRIEIAVRRACGAPSAGGRPRPGCAPDLVVVEGTFSRPGGSDYPLHAVRGCVLQWLYRQGIPYVDVAPATLKVWATGSGATSGANKVTKDKVCAGIVAAYGHLLAINPRDDNACDAVGLLTLGLAAYGQPLAAVPDRHRRALQVPQWPVLDTTPERPRSGAASIAAGPRGTPTPTGAPR